MAARIGVCLCAAAAGSGGIAARSGAHAGPPRPSIWPLNRHTLRLRTLRPARPLPASVARPAGTPSGVPAVIQRPPRRLDHHTLGIVCMVGAVAGFSALDATSKAVTAFAPVWMALWMRFLLQVLTTGVLLLPRQGLSLLRTQAPYQQALRGLLLVGTNGLAYLSLAHLPVAEFTSITMLLPLLLTVAAAWLLKERVPGWRWLCLAGSFAGVVLVIRPGGGLWRLESVLPLLLVVGGTAFQLLTRTLARTESPGTIHLYSGLVGLVLSSAMLPMAWQSLPASGWWLLGAMGLFGAIGHFLLIQAYVHAPVAVLTPYLYAQVGFAALAGWLVFDQFPDGWALAGMALVLGFGLLAAVLARRLPR